MQPSGEKPSEKQFEYVSAYIGSRKGFKISNYINNEPMIRSLYSEKIRALNACLILEEKSINLEDKLKKSEIELSSTLNKLDLQNKDIEHNNIKAIWQSILILLGATLSGFGVNLVTSSPSNWAGWLMCIFGFVLQVTAIAIALFPRKKREKTNG